jgi:hypothetical protein
MLSLAANPTSGTTAATATGWSLVTSPNTSTTQNNTLYGVSCASASDCWAVGYYNDSNNVAQTLIEHYSGTAWTVASSANTLPVEHNFLKSVSCAAAANCSAIGYYNNRANDQTLIEQYNGTTWSTASSLAPGAALENYLYGVTCASPTDCWAVGDYISTNQNGTYQNTLIELFNGTTWSIVNSPNTNELSNVLNSVTCTSTTDCWAVGYSQNATSVYQTLIERWNGTAWSVVSSANTSTTQNNVLDSVTCSSASDCWAVGYYNDGTFHTLIERWNGSTWSVVNSPSPSATENYLKGVACASSTNCWAVGYYQNQGSNWQTLIEQWNGASWAIVSSPNTSANEDNFLLGVTCASASDCWTVGVYWNGYNQTLIARYTVSPPVPLLDVVSRKVHGGTNERDIPLPLTGTRGVECRSPGQTGTAGFDYKVVFTFVNNITNCGTAGTAGGSVVSGPNANQCTEDLNGLPNAQYTTVALNGVIDVAGNNGPVSAPMGLLVGDVNANGTVSNADVASIQTQIGAAVDTNFRNDINANGTLSNGDVAAAQAKVGTQLPSLP